jgi:hypothetical protein
MAVWEYLFVVAVARGGVLCPHTINGQAVDARDQLPLADYIAEVGQQGWELSGVAKSEDSADRSMRLIFRRDRTAAQ